MITDVNVYLSRWPFRRLPCDETPRFLERLQRLNVTQAWVGSFDGILHRDVGGVNARLAEECQKHPKGLLVPFGSVNPKLPDWQEDLRRCHEDHHMPGVRLHPNYHDYRLDDPVFAELLTLAQKSGLIVQLVVRMEDLRTQHPLLQVPDVGIKPLSALVAARPKLHLVILNGQRTIHGNMLRQLVGAGNVYFDIAVQEAVGGVANLLGSLPLERVLFGSHFPLFNLESAVLKMRESELSPAQSEAIAHENAHRLLGDGRGANGL